MEKAQMDQLLKHVCDKYNALVNFLSSFNKMYYPYSGTRVGLRIRSDEKIEIEMRYHEEEAPPISVSFLPSVPVVKFGLWIPGERVEDNRMMSVMLYLVSKMDEVVPLLMALVKNLQATEEKVHEKFIDNLGELNKSITTSFPSEITDILVEGNPLEEMFSKDYSSILTRSLKKVRDHIFTFRVHKVWEIDNI